MISINKLKFSNLILLILFLFIFLIPTNLIFLTLDKNNNTVIENDTPLEITDLKISGVSGKIDILGEQGWLDFKNAGNCTGLGTYYDPFVIQDLIIDGHGSGSGIKITLSRNYFFRIENCTIFNCSYGIELFSTDNGTLYQNDCSFNGIGIYLHCPSKPSPETYGCFNNTIIENIANNAMYGIHLDWGVTGDIINNTANNNVRGIYHKGYPYIISGNTVNSNQYGLYLQGANFLFNIITGNTVNRNHIGIYIACHGNNSIISNNILYNNRDCAIAFGGIGYTLTGNLMKGSGLALGYTSVEELSLLNIDTSNLVNNKFIYYYINRSNLIQEDFNDAGQIFLINCINSVISNRNVSNSTQGITLFHSNNITVINVNSSYNLYGIFAFNTNNSIFIGNTLNEGDYGISLRGKNNTISESNINYNIWGIELSFNTDYNIISENYINDNINGIWIIGCRFNTISGNIIKDNYISGLRLIGGVFACKNNTFFLNFFIRNGIHVEGSAINLNDNDWNNTEIGNYWDNYTGSDNDGDGIGDIPHIISLSPLIIDYLPIVDNDPPIITIIKPINNSKFGSLAPSFNIRVEEKYLDVMWYTLDGGLNNYTFTENGTINQGAWDALNFDHNILRFYAVDKVGYISFMDIVVVKKIPETEIIPGYSLFVLFCVISIIGVTLIVISRKSYSLEGLKKSYRKF